MDVESGNPGREKGYSLVEVILAVVIGTVVLMLLIGFLRQGSRLEDQMGALLSFQMDAQKALTVFLRDLQEGMAVIQPPPGHTLPHAVVRDKLDRLAYYSLVPSGKTGLYDLRRDLATAGKVETSLVVQGVARITFSALSDASLLIHGTLGTGDRRYSFHTEVRLRNRDALEAK